jgi:hypothetical protein
MLLTGLRRIFETVVEQWTGATEFAGRNGRIFAHRFVGDVFREKQFRGTGAGHVVRVVEFDEEIVEAVSVVEHKMKPNKERKQKCLRHTSFS